MGKKVLVSLEETRQFDIDAKKEEIPLLLLRKEHPKLYVRVWGHQLALLNCPGSGLRRSRLRFKKSTKRRAK